VIDRINAVYAQDPLARVWVVLPTSRQEYALRQRLIEEGDGRAPLFNLELFNFYTLYERVLLAAKTPTYSVHGMARTLLLRQVIQQTLNGREHSPFATIATTLGFAQLVADLIDELKAARVEPSHFAAVAQTAKDHELAELYSLYQTVLRRESAYGDKTPLVDTEGEGWLALEVLERQQPFLKLGLLAIDGFDQLTQVQADLIHALSKQAEHTLVTLSDMPERVGGRVAQAQRLLLRGNPNITVTHVQSRPFESPMLGHLTAQAFREPSDKIPLTGDALTLIEGANPFIEAREVIRQVKRRLINDPAARPDHFLIAVRDWPTYGAALSAAAEEFGVPLAAHHGQPLLEHPLGAFFDGLLRLSEEDFPRSEVVDILYSPYIDLNPEDALPPALIEQIGLRAQLLSGTEAWLDAVKGAADSLFDDYKGEISPLIRENDVDSLQQRLSQFFNRLTLPPYASLTHYVQTLEEWLGNDDPQTDPSEGDDQRVKLIYSFNIIRALRQTPDESASARDLDAIRALKTALRQLLNAHELVRWASQTQSGDAPVLTRDTFLTDLRAVMGATKLREQPGRAGRVLLTLVTDARGLPHQHVIMTGLSEGLFPGKTSDDPLYLDTERADLSARLRDQFGYDTPLKTRAERSGDDSVFFELMGLPRQSLTLSRPYIQNGAQWPASYLWRAVETVFESIPSEHRLRARPGGIPALSDAATLSELALALTHTPDAPDAAGSAAYLKAEQPKALHHLRLAYNTESDRLRLDLPWDDYSGVLTNSPWAADIDGKFARQVWSVSALEAFGASPYRFFAQKLLKLDEWEAPDDNLDVAMLGTVLHNLFNQLYTALIQAGLPVHPDHAETALALVDANLPDLLQRAPTDHHFPDSALWQLESGSLMRRVRTLIERDYTGNNPITNEFPDMADTERWPLLREWKFGDENSTRVRLPLPDGSSITMRGTFDRVDVAQVRGEIVFVVIDYKSGGSKYDAAEFTGGRKVQMPVYIRVLQVLLASGAIDATMRANGLDTSLPKRVLGGLYWGVAGKYESLTTVKADNDEMMETTLKHVANFVNQIRAAQFKPYASKPDKGKCFAYCAFHDLCRVCDIQLDKPISQ
jgi:ATP-dependent helicase/DNAse subunit B